MQAKTATPWLLVGYALFVVYGSLVPLEFTALPLDVAWQRFQHIPFLTLGIESRADWVANGVLYAPLGLLASRVGFERGLAPWLAAALAGLAGCALGVAVEFTQLYFPGRTVSQNDIMAECIGSVLGAVAASVLATRVDRLSQAWRTGGTRLLPRLLELYTIGYLLLCFFPYDLLLSVAEVQDKWQAGGWSWGFAPQERGIFFVALQWLVEVAIAVPIGAMGLFQQTGRARLGRALAVGALLGVLIEVGQFFVSSGISQGMSVASRMLGVALGACLVPWVRRVGWHGVRDATGVLAPWVWLPYVLTLAAVAGAMRYPAQGLAGAWASWQGTRLMPFYYHYFTTEALAMFSLGSVALMYAPVAVLVWSRGGSTALSAVLVAVLAALVETGKLFLQGAHADPTNIIVAVAVNLLVRRVLGVAESETKAAPASPAGAVDAAQTAADTATLAPKQSSGALLLAVPLAAVLAVLFPVFSWPLLALLAAAAALVWRWPALTLAIVPAALPLLDWAPWSGRFFWDEFDLLQLVCLAVALHRAPRFAKTSVGTAESSRLVTWAFMALGLSLGLSTLRGLAGLSGLDANSFSTYYSPFNALRIVKGAAWAWLFVLLWQRLQPRAAQADHRVPLFSAGMSIGLAMTVLVVMAERSVFAGLLDFSADFRVTGPFSAMHKGGAYIECFLALASAFALVPVLRPGPPALRAAALLLWAGAGYAMFVTYSRNGYAAWVVVLLATLAAQGVAVFRGSGAAAPGSARTRMVFAAYAGLSLLVVLGLALPIAGGSYARQRLAQSAADLTLRQQHWQDGLALRNEGTLEALLGAGIGRFPERHFWQSREARRAASYRLDSEGDTRYLRLGQGATLYIEQIVTPPADGLLRMSFDWRGQAGQADQRPPDVALCEKWTLTSLACASVTAPAPPAARETPALPVPMPAASGAANSLATGMPWQTVERTLDATALMARPGVLRAPLKLSLLTPAQGSVEVTRLSLAPASGGNLLVNGDFKQGMDRWFFATDVDPPWHLHSLPLAVLFDQGWLGALAWAALAAAVLWRGTRLLWQGAAQVPAALPAVLGFAVSGLLNTLIDAPRFLWLLLVLLWLATARTPPRSAA